MKNPTRRAILGYLLAVFSVGLAIGATTGYTWAKRAPSQLPSEQEAEAKWLAKYKSRLSLSEEQVRAIRPLLPEAVERLGGIWYRAIMTMGAVGEGVDRKIEPLLDKKQRAKLLDYIRSERERRRWIARAMFPKGADEAPDLWEAARRGDTEAIGRNLADGADVNKLDLGFGLPPLTIAAIHGRTNAIDLLLRSGADVNVRHLDGNTALHAAAFFGRRESVQSLLEAGADPSARNDEGRTPLAGMGADWGSILFIATMLQVELNQEDVLAGRKAVEQLLAAIDH